MKRGLCFLLTVGALTHCFGQGVPTPKTGRFGYGLFAGLNYSHPIVRTRFPDHFSPYSSLFAGLDLSYDLSRSSSVRVQPSWFRTNDVSLKGGYTSFVLSSTTLKIPVLYRHYVLPSRRLLFVEAGGSYNHVVSGNYREELVVNCIVGPCPTFYGPERSFSNKATVSAVAGVGVTIDVQKVSIPVTLRYERYLSGYTLTGESYGASPSLKYENFALTTGINF